MPAAQQTMPCQMADVYQIASLVLSIYVQGISSKHVSLSHAAGDRDGSRLQAHDATAMSTGQLPGSVAHDPQRVLCSRPGPYAWTMRLDGADQLHQLTCGNTKFLESFSRFCSNLLNQDRST